VATFRDPLINVYVQDVEGMARFYAEQFGFRESFRTPQTGVAEHIELRIEGLTLGFASSESARRVHGFTAGTDGPRHEVALWTEDVDATYAHLLSVGAGPVSPPHDFLDGRLRSAWVTDPEGNHVQIVMRKDQPAAPSH
jgi:uncharacterized glyoxalase superfamily protein PhnB